MFDRLRSGRGASPRPHGYLVALSVALVLLSGCSTPQRLSAVPSDLTERATPPEGQVRFWTDADPKPLIVEVNARYQRELDERARNGETGPLPPQDFLAISGGGDDGAFGAGLLCGWTKAGGRPVFTLVTGVSTGALIAPFAFLGPKYDPVLREAYTQVSQKDIFKKRNLILGVMGDAMSDASPLAKLVSRYVTPELLNEIAVEYRKGRLLMIGTTDLDARRGVIWNMGAIATSHDPHAIDLFRQIILASAAIPGVFPPVMIDVTVDGVKYQEMHVDGGATNQVFMYPEALELTEVIPDLAAARERKVYVIRNARLDPDWANTDRRTLKIVGRAVTSLIQTQGAGDLTRIYVTAERDHIDFNLAYIPSDFKITKTADFNPQYMRPLFDRGYQMGLDGSAWQKAPPHMASFVK